MGINISLYRLTYDKKIGKLDFIKDNSFNSIRQGIDNHVNSELSKLYLSPYCDCVYSYHEQFWRPVDVESAKLWAFDKAKELKMDSAHDRWVLAFHKIQNDMTYWFQPLIKEFYA
jgi:hypothetical protein